MPHPLDPRDYRLIPAYKYLNGKAQRLPKNKWTLAVALIVLVLLDHWLIWPILIGGGIVLIGWLIRLVIRQGGRSW